MEFMDPRSDQKQTCPRIKRTLIINGYTSWDTKYWLKRLSQPIKMTNANKKHSTDHQHSSRYTIYRPLNKFLYNLQRLRTNYYPWRDFQQNDEKLFFQTESSDHFPILGTFQVFQIFNVF